MGFFDQYKRKTSFFDDFKTDKSRKVEENISTSEAFRPADEEVLDKGKSLTGSLSNIIEGGLRAATGRPVPAELSAGIKQPETIDVREETNVIGPDSPSNIIPDIFVGDKSEETSKLGNAGRRFLEGLRQSDDFLEERRAASLGLGDDVRSLRPQQATEDTRIVSRPDSIVEHGIDLLGKVAPEALGAVAGGGLTGASEAVASSLPGAGANLATRVAARTGADIGIGLAENFAGALEAPSPELAAGVGVFSLAFQAIPGGGRFAQKLIADGTFGETASRIWKNVFRTGDEHAANILDALSREIGGSADEAAGQVAKVADDAGGAVGKAGGPSTQVDDALTEFEKIAKEVSEQTDKEFAEATRLPDADAPAAPALESSQLSGGTSFRGLQERARNAGGSLELRDDGSLEVVLGDQVTRVSNFKEAAAVIDGLPAKPTLNQALADSISEVTDSAGQVVDDAVGKVKSVALSRGNSVEVEMAEVAGLVADLPTQKAREVFLRGVAEADDLSQLSSGMDPRVPLRNLVNLAEKSANPYRELYINALLTHPGTHFVNLVSNFIQLPIRTADQAFEAGLGTGVRTARRFGINLTGDFYDELAGRTFADVGKSMKGYAQGAKHYPDILEEIGRNHRLRQSMSRAKGGSGEIGPLPEAEQAALDALNKAEDEGFMRAALDRFIAFRRMFTHDGGDDVAAALDNSLSAKFDSVVELGGLPAEALGKTATSEGKALNKPLVSLLGEKAGNRAASVLRSPTQFLQVGDAFFKDMVFHSEYSFAKSRLLSKYGITPDLLTRSSSSLTDEEAKVIAKFRKEATAIATEQARFQTFTNKLGIWGQTASKLRDKTNLPFLPAGTILSPFMTTPINILKYTGRHSPFGAFQVAYKALSESSNATSRELVERIAQSGVGTMLMMGTWYLMNQGVISIDGTITQGAESRTRELATGGQIRNYTLDLGTRLPLNRFGPLGLIMGATADTYYRMDEIVEERMLQAEKDESRGAITPEELAAIREQAVNDSFALRLYRSPELAGGAVGSVLANNVYNESALTGVFEALELMAKAKLSNDPTSSQQAIAFLEKKAATAAQPFAGVNSLAKAFDPSTTSPNPDDSFLSRVATRTKERIPGLDPKPGGTRHRDIFGNVRRARYPLDDSESGITKVLGSMVDPFGPKSQMVGDAKRDRSTEIAQEMERLKVFKDFPRMPTTVRKEYGRIPSAVVEQAQAIRGQIRFSIVSKLLDKESYARADDEKKERMLRKAFSLADSKSSKFINTALKKQSKKGEPFDLATGIRESIAERYDLDIPEYNGASEEEDAGFFSRLRRQ